MHTPAPHYNRRLDAIRRQLIGWGMEFGNAVRPTKPPVVILQMGKVGSTSLTDAIRQCKKFSVFQIHLLNPNSIDTYIQRCEEVGDYTYRHLIRSEFVNSRSILTDNRLKIITIVRDPVARNISSFFQNLRYHYPNFSHSDADDEMLCDRFFNSNLHEFPIDYFDNEIKKTLGLDVYAYNFPVHEGYKIIRTPSLEMLIFQFEMDELSKTREICNFLNLDSINIPKLNRSEKKNYADNYRRVVESISFSRDFLDRMYNSKYVRHFYSPEQIRAFRSHWSRNSNECRL